MIQAKTETDRWRESVKRDKREYRGETIQEEGFVSAEDFEATTGIKEYESKKDEPITYIALRGHVVFIVKKFL